VPRLLKRGTIRRIGGALDSLQLALFGLAIPHCTSAEESASKRSAVIGLLGSSAELALASCLHEVLGESSLVKSDGSYLVAGEILVLFRRVIRSGTPRLATLTRGIGAPEKHLVELAEATMPFRVLFTARALGLHAAAGVSHDVGVAAATDVHRFLSLLAKGDRWQPYLREIPTPPPIPTERMMLAEEIARTLGDEPSGEVVGAKLKSLFLVLPELVEETPEWLAALDRVQVAPSKSDLTVLLRSLRNAEAGRLLKIRRGAKAIPTRVEQDNAAALPVRIERYRRTVSSLEDRFQVDVTEANTYLDQGRLRTPPIRSIYDYFAVGIESLGLPDQQLELGLTGHEVWPMVAGALQYSGTPGPLFYILRFLDPTENGQMMAQLDRAAALSEHMRSRLDSHRVLLVEPHCAQAQQSDRTYTELASSLNERLTFRSELETKISDRFKRMGALPAAAARSVIEELRSSDDLSSSIEAAVSNQAGLDKTAMPTIRDLVIASTEREEVFALLGILDDRELGAVHTDVRKALRVIDFSAYYLLPEVGDSPLDRFAGRPGSAGDRP